MCADCVTVKIHHGGSFSEDDGLNYMGVQVTIF